jgi:cobalt-zinc-cadmium efflux system outer membrane protein
MNISPTPAAQAVLALVFFGLFAQAAESQPQGNGRLTLEQAISRTLANHPALVTAALRVETERARRDTQALSTPLMLGADVENIAGTGDASGIDAVETTLRVSKVFERGDKQSLRAELGQSRVEESRIAAAAQELAVITDVTRRYVELAGRQAQIELAGEASRLNRRMLDIIEDRVAAGRASQAEESSARIAILRSDLAQRELETQFAGARAELASLWGSASADFESVAGDLLALPPGPEFAALDARIENNADIRRLDMARRTVAARRQLAVAQRRPDIEFSAGIRHLAELNDMALVFSFSMPFGSRERAASLVRETEVAEATLPAQRDAQMRSLTSALQFLRMQSLAAHETCESLQATIIPEVEVSVRFYERGFEFGSNSLLELNAAQAQLLALRREAVEAAIRYHLSLIEIESLLGNPNPGGGLI